jgi:hypothetical protein
MPTHLGIRIDILSPMAKQLVTSVFTFVPAVLIGGSALGKLFMMEPVTVSLNALGLGPYIRPLGVLELGLLFLWLLKPTRNVGFFTLCSYFGGAIASHLLHPTDIANPLLILVLLWIATFLRAPSLFGFAEKEAE